MNLNYIKHVLESHGVEYVVQPEGIWAIGAVTREWNNVHSVWVTTAEWEPVHNMSKTQLLRWLGY